MHLELGFMSITMKERQEDSVYEETQDDCFSWESSLLFLPNALGSPASRLSVLSPEQHQSPSVVLSAPPTPTAARQFLWWYLKSVATILNLPQHTRLPPLAGEQPKAIKLLPEVSLACST